MRLLTLRFRLAVALSLLTLGCGPEAQINASAYLSPPLAVEMLTVTVHDGGHAWQWHGSDFSVTTSNATATTPVVSTRTRGDLVVRFQLQAADQLVSEGAVVLPLREDWRWGIGIHAATADPRLQCFGCVGSQAFPLVATFRPPGRDSIWVVWGGNYISHPVVY